MKRTNRLVILVGVLLAVLAFVGIVVLLGQQKPPPVAKTTVSVLVAKADIAVGDSVTADSVDAIDVEPGAVTGTRFADKSQLTGAPALFPIAKGSQVSQEAVGRGATGNYCISCQLKAGERAIAFQVDRVTGLDFLIQPGDHVDVVFRAEITPLQATADTVGSAHPRFEPITGLEQAPTVKTLLQDKRVLYVSGTKVQSIATPAATPAPGTSGGTSTTPQVQLESVVIIFAGTDADAELVKFAQTDNNIIGPLTAVLRATNDTDVEKTAGVSLKILVDSFGIPVPDIIQVAPPKTP